MPDSGKSWLADHYRLVLVLILLVAAVLRIYGLNNLSPPGLEHDEVAHWLIDRDILAGKHSLYFTEAYGHEAGYHYLQTGFLALLGANAFTLRLPSAFSGILLIAVTFALLRRLFGLQTALLSAALLAVLFWPVFYSRLALRAISLPLLSGLSAYFWWRGWQAGEYPTGAGTNKRVGRDNRSSAASTVGQRLASSLARPATFFVVAGIFAGLSLYTYMAARALPIFYGLFILYLIVFHRPALKTRSRSIILFTAIFVVVGAPLAIYLLNNPGAEVRIEEVNAPLQAIGQGDWRPVLENGFRVLAMFGLRGDPLWRQNVAYLPVFGPVLALFFYIGSLICLWRWREPRHLFLILWLLTATIPSIVTIDAPSSIRIINALPVLPAFPVIGLQVIHFFRPLSTVSTHLSPKSGRRLALIGVLAVLLFNAGRTARAIFYVWPVNEEVQFVWQEALTQAAAYLDQSASAEPVAIGGWTPDSMDPPTMALSLHRDDLDLRFFDPLQAVIVPFAPAGESSRIIRPTVLPLTPSLEAQLQAWGASPRSIETFTLYELAGRPAPSPDLGQPASFGGELTFLGFELVAPCEPRPANTCEIVTYWRVEQPAGEPRRFFLHLQESEGQIVAQDDRLGAPAEYWRPGDILLQQHWLTLPASEEAGTGPYEVQLGVYEPGSGRRLLTAESLDSVRLSFFQVE